MLAIAVSSQSAVGLSLDILLSLANIAHCWSRASLPTPGSTPSEEKMLSMSAALNLIDSTSAKVGGSNNSTHDRASFSDEWIVGWTIDFNWKRSFSDYGVGVY